MDSFGSVRALANERFDEMRSHANGNCKPIALLNAAREHHEISVRRLPPEHPLLAGGDGALHRDASVIYVSESLSDEMAYFVEAHEWGHYWIETPSDPAVVATNTDPGDPVEATPLGLKRVEAYSAQELRERFANVFGREFLLPLNEAKRRYSKEKQTANIIAKDLVLPIGLVYQQLAAALLLPEPPKPTDDQAGPPPSLDDSQKRAATHHGTPLLVEAGPGTGKTRTLIGRIEHLIDKGEPPASILALTFSNKAANEIRERVAANMQAAAAEVWAGTFHAFGLELLRKYGHFANVADPVRLLDQADLLATLEEDLPDLGLDHYLRLYEPVSQLRDILNAISRSKDEVKTPTDYLSAAEQMMLTARTDEDRVKAERAVEVARVYAHYDAKMRDEGMVDFADLINRPVEILRSHPQIRDELRRQYQHVLVDEYQDVNRASALLVKELVGDGERLWVVGDARQSIYRFRGAAPINTMRFENDYPTGVRVPLEINYRSRAQIVDAFESYASAMRVQSASRPRLISHRGPGESAVRLHVARDRDAEIAGIAETIRAHNAAGIVYADQAVLCRVHGNLEHIAMGLERAGIPVLYLGDLFERPEVRDLLSLISFTAEPTRGGLLRLAQCDAYRMHLDDVQAFLQHAARSDYSPWRALADVDEIAELSESGCASLNRLRIDLEGVGYKTGPGTLLCHVLFNRATMINEYLSGSSPKEQQHRLAIHQFLQFTIENNAKGDGDPKKALLDWVRRLEIFGDERALREPPSAVEGIDAVRLMTVHASKGLEFKVIHLPNLGKGMFPLRRRGQPCPLPDGLLSTKPEDDHVEEEQCLFYVGLSRAEDHLSLSRAERYSEKRRSNASEALDVIANHAAHGQESWTNSLPTVTMDDNRCDLLVDDREHDGRDIELYMRCPRRYLYQVVLRFSGSREDNGYVQFHRAVYRVLRWMGKQDSPPTRESMDDAIRAAWEEIGPHDHPLEPLYRTAAHGILRKAEGRPRSGIRYAEKLSFQIDGQTIAVTIDEIEGKGKQAVIRRLRTGRAPKKSDQRHLHAMMLEAGRQSGDGGRFEAHYLTDEQTVPVNFERVLENRLNDTRGALRDIRTGRFPAAPSEDCPRCAHYFICPGVPDPAS